MLTIPLSNNNGMFWLHNNKWVFSKEVKHNQAETFHAHDDFIALVCMRLDCVRDFQN